MESFYGGRKGLDFKIFGCYSSLPTEESVKATIPNGYYIVVTEMAEGSSTSKPSVLYYKNFDGKFQYVGPLFHSPDIPQVMIDNYTEIPSDNEKVFAVIKQNGEHAAVQGKVRQKIENGAITMGFAFPSINIENDTNNIFELKLANADTLTYKFIAAAGQGFAVSINSKDDIEGIAYGGAGFF